MKRLLTVSCAAAVALLTAVAPVSAGDFHGGLQVGSSVGLGVQATGTFMNFTRDVPLSARFTFGVHSPDAGDPYAARRIFINDNTNGTPEKSARAWQFRFDLLVPALHVGQQQIYVFGGPRHARYTATYNFVGGNENFDVQSNPWGLGVGLETWFAINDRTDFLLSGGIDWFAKARLSGHDTSYSPDGDDVNGRNDYTWDDADDAIAQPRWEVMAMMGLRFAL